MFGHIQKTLLGILPIVFLGAEATVTAQSITETSELVADERGENFGFGFDIATNGSLVLVSARGANDFVGAVYAFDLNIGLQVGTIESDDSRVGGSFGQSIALGENIAVVGTSYDNVDGMSEAGSVYIFDVSTPATPVQIAKVTEPIASRRGHFGHSVAVTGDTVVASAPGGFSAGSHVNAVYLFDAGTGVQIHRIVPEPQTPSSSAYGDGVAISGNLLAVGDPSVYIPGADQGAVFLYDITVRTSPILLGTLTRTLDLPTTSSFFGREIVIRGNLAIVGSSGEDLGGTSAPPFNHGAVYVYDISDPSAPILLSSLGGQGRESFGTDLGIAGDLLVIGAAGGTGSFNGSAYLYNVADPASPQRMARLLQSDPQNNQRFGMSVGVGGDRAYVGASRYSDGEGTARGKTYVFNTTDLPCNLADLTEPFGLLGTADISAFVTAFLSNDSAVDYAPPHLIFDLADIVAFLTAFNNGCPD